MRSTWVLLGAALALAACDDDAATTARQATDSAPADAGAADATTPDAAPPAVAPDEGRWRLALSFPDLGVHLAGVLGISAGPEGLGLTLALVADDGTESDVLAEVAAVPVDADGGFRVVIDPLTIPAAFSPTGGPLAVALTLDGQVRADDFLCGTAGGHVPELMLDLGAGTFAATPEGGAEPPTSCDADPGPDDGPTLGGERPARVLLPAAYAADGPAWPLILLLHGFGSNGGQQDGYLRLSAQRDAAGFIAVIPDGTVDPDGDRFWNATPACCDDFGAGVDDVAYLAGLIDEALATYHVDPTRVYLIGHSNGAFMSYRLACTLGARIAGIVALAGSTVLDEADCATTDAVSVLHIHAEDDGTVPYTGVDRPVDGYPGAVETAARWAARAGCADAPQAGEPLELVASVPGAETAVASYPGCTDEAEVALWSLSAGGHVPAFGARFVETALPWLLAQ